MYSTQVDENQPFEIFPTCVPCVSLHFDTLQALAEGIYYGILYLVTYELEKSQE